MNQPQAGGISLDPQRSAASPSAPRAANRIPLFSLRAPCIYATKLVGFAGACHWSVLLEVWIMKKRIALAALMLCIACASIFAFGIGVQGGTDVAKHGVTGVAVTFKLSSIPLLFAVEIPSFDPFALGVSADYWIVNPAIIGNSALSLNWYIGAGIFGDFFIGDDFYAGLGARVPIGINLFFLKQILELYLQVAPGVEFEVGNGFDVGFTCPVNYGLRVWIGGH